MCCSNTFGNRCIHGNNCLYRHADGEEKPSKRSESTEGAVAIVSKSPRLCISQITSKDVHSAGSWANEIELFGGTRCKNSQDASGAKFKFGKEKGHLETLSKKINLRSEILARRSLRKELLRSPQSSMGFGEKIHKVKAEDKATFYSPVKIQAPDGKGSLRTFFENTVGRSFELGMFLFVNRARGLFLSLHVDNM